MSKKTENQEAAAQLQALYDDTISEATDADKSVYGNAIDDTSLPANIRKDLDVILEKSDTHRAALAVVITLLLKKFISPSHDIRNHQAGMAGGFSGRGLDERVVTPFLRRNDFPYMQSGSGWLTRSFEQNRPYDYDYPGKITPAPLKKAFLRVIAAVQENASYAKPCLVYALLMLLNRRDKRKDIQLDRPTGLNIHQIVARLSVHFASSDRGAARLPVLAIYAVYQQLVKEVKRYKGWTLEDLQPHTSADNRTGFLGDIQLSLDGRAMEAVEIKHNVQLTPALVQACHDKIKKTPVKTYYLLSTDESLNHKKEIDAEVAKIRSGHGCEMIVNGLIQTLKYYLRLLEDTTAFVNDYVSLLEKDQAVPYALKIKWNEREKS